VIVFERAVTGVECRAPSAKPNKERIELDNGSRIISRPANPRTIRSFHGDIHWDETAITAHDGEIFKAAWAIASRHDYRVSLISTPFGESGVFYERVRGAGAKHWSVHTTTIHEAVAQGCPVNLEEVRSGVADVETWQQEYECAFLGDAQSYFPFDLLRRVASTGEELLARMQSDKPKMPREWFGGIDVGRHRDLTAVAWLGAFDDGRGLLLPVDVLRKAPFEQQHDWWLAAIRTRRPRGVLIDSTGMGAAPAERLQRAFPGVVRGYDFSRGNAKRAMVEHARTAMEEGKFGLDPSDRDTLAEFHTIKRVILPAGGITYRAERMLDGRTNPDGHADRASAAMLAELNRAGVPQWFFDAPTAVGASDVQAMFEEEAQRMHEEALAAQNRAESPLARHLAALRGWEPSLAPTETTTEQSPGPWRGSF
jgi:phage FluMu gp28-like protein